MVIDGNDFKPYFEVCERLGYRSYSHVCVEGGDNKYAHIAASILAKVSRDEYIEELCENDPTLNEKYDLLKNIYGTKKHMDGIKNME